jgi:hypothetical protein
MTITFTLNINTVSNVSYSIGSRIARIAATTAGTSGTLATVSGISGAQNINWTLQGAPSWLSINGSTGALSFTSVGIATISLYETAIIATDAVNSSNVTIYPITLEVLPALYIRESNSLTTINATTLNSSVSNLINAYGADNTSLQTDVNFAVVGTLPTGLNLRTTKDNSVLYGDLKTVTDVRGGIKTAGTAQTVQIKAFKAGTFYDHPDRACALSLVYNVTDATPGNIETAIYGYVDSSQTPPVVRLHARSEVRSGKGAPLSYQWTTSGPVSGSFLDSSQTATMNWAPTGSVAGQVVFNLVVTGTGTSTPTYTAATLTLDIAPSAWSTSGKLKIIPSDISKLESQGSSTQTVTFGVKLTDLATGQIAVLSPTVTAVGSAPAATTPTITINGTTTSAYSDSNGANNDIALLTFVVPAGATTGDKYVIQVNAATSGNARIGSLTYYVVCNGNQKLNITPSSSSVTINNGVLYNSSTPILNLSCAQTGLDYALVNAPAGLSIDSNGNLVGKAYTGQAGTLRVYAGKSTYQYDDDSIVIPFQVTNVLDMTAPTLSTATPVITSGSQTRVDWGYTGTATSFYLKKNQDAEIQLSGSASTYLFPSITANSAIGLRAVTDIGEVLAAPIQISINSAGSVAQLPASPAVAYLYEDYSVDLNWTPVPINSSYSSYREWSVWYRYDNGSETLLPIIGLTGLETGGTPTARKASFSMANNPPAIGSQVFLDMQAISADSSSILSSFRWNKTDANPPHPMCSFPKVGTILLDKSTASKNEPIKVTIAGFSGDKWRVVTQDGSTSQFYPMSTTSTSISFPIGGVNERLRVEVCNDYSGQIPSVQLYSVALKDIFILDQDYVAPATDDPLGNIGFGGDQGFEISDATNGTAHLQPYVSIVRSLVKDEVTNELKLMVATSRTQDGASSLGTMAIDVFPILGRPHIKDLVKPLSSESYSSEIITPVKITSQLLSDMVVGQFVEMKMAASGGTTPYSWYASALPAGLNMRTDGTLYGSVFQIGSYKIAVSVGDSSDPAFISEKSFNLVVKSDLQISTTTVAAATVNALYSQALATQGGVGPYRWLLVGGELPAGLSVDPVTGTISGYAATYNSNQDFSKTYTFVVQATDSVGAKASKQLTMGLSRAPLTLSSLDQLVIYQGEKFRLTSKIYGGTSPYNSLSISDASNTLSLSNSRIVDGCLEFDVPEVVVAGNYTFSATVHDAAGTSVTKSFTYTVRPYLGEFRIIDSYPEIVYNASEHADHFFVTATSSGSTVTLMSSTTLPNGLSVSYDNANNRINVKGPATAGQNLEFPITLSITGSASDGIISKMFSVSSYTGAYTTDAPGVKTIQTEPYKVGTQVVLDTNKPYMNSVTGSRTVGTITRVKSGQKLPNGLSLDSKTGLLYGVIEDTNVQTSILEIVTESTGDVVGIININFAIKNDRGLILDVTNLGAAKRALAYTGTVKAQVPAQAPLSVSVVKGSLPPGITMSTVGTMINFTGTPTTGGFYDMWIDISDATGAKELLYKRFEVGYSTAVALQTTTIPNIVQNSAYAFNLSAIGGVAPYTYSLVSGNFPTGVGMDSTGRISGTSTLSSFSAPVTIRVTDSSSLTDTRTYAVKIDSSNDVSTVTGTALIGNWPTDQPDLSLITRLNQSTDAKLKAFMVRVSGIDSLTGIQASVDDVNLSATIVSTQVENSINVAYVQILNKAKTSPTTLGLPVGNKTFNLTVSNPATGKISNKTLSYNVVAVESSALNLYSLDNLPSVSPRPVNEFAFLGSSASSLLAATNSTLFSIYVPGLDLLAKPIDIVANGIVKISDITSGLAGKFTLSQEGIIGGRALVNLNYTGTDFDAPVSNQTITVLVQDVAYINTTGSGPYVMDVFSNGPRQHQINVLQLVKAKIASYPTTVTLDSPYSFQINFATPLNSIQSPTVVYSGLHGVTNASFVTNQDNQIIGYRINGTWTKESQETYPKSYNVSVKMTENTKYVRDTGNASMTVVTHFDQVLPIVVAASNPITLDPWDTSNQIVGTYNTFMTGAAVYNTDPGTVSNAPTVKTQGSVSKNYKIKIVGTDQTNPIAGGSVLNLPLGIRFNNSYTSTDMSNALATGGLSTTGVSNLMTLNSKYRGFWALCPAVSTSVDYSTPDQVVANALLIQDTNIPVKIDVLDTSSSVISTGYGNLTVKTPGTDKYRGGFVVVALIPNNYGPDTFKILGYNTGGSFPLTGGSWDNATAIKIYIFGQIPYLAYNTEKFSRVIGNGISVTETTSQSDPVITKIASQGMYLQDDISNTSTFYSNFFTNCYNSYTLYAGDNNPHNVSIDVYTGSAQEPEFTTWAPGKKQGRMKYNRINLTVRIIQVIYTPPPYTPPDPTPTPTPIPDPWVPKPDPTPIPDPPPTPTPTPDPIPTPPPTPPPTSVDTGGGGNPSGGNGVGGSGCLPLGSPILMKTGYKAVESLHIGDKVYGLNDTTLEPVESTVEELYVYENREIYSIITEFGSFLCSHDHRLATLSGEDILYVPARELKKEDKILYVDSVKNAWVQILSVISTNKYDTVYHMRLDTGHVYVGSGFAAHNTKVNVTTMNNTE